MTGKMDILDRLQDLWKQATKERSHYYVFATAQAAIREIVALRAVLAEQSERVAWLRDENRRLWTAVEQAREERDHEAERDGPPEGEGGGS